MNDNNTIAGKRNPCFCPVLAILIVIIMLIPRAACCITVAEEEELGSEFMKVVSKHFERIKDPLVISYMEVVGKRILSVIEPQPFPYQFHIIRNDDYNAFAGPAGHIFINSGLFNDMDNEEELAGIISHEIAHAICRHISQRIERSSKINLATLAGIAAGVLLGIAGAGAAAVNAVTIGSVAAGQSVSLSYSRDDEMQADQIGLKYLTDAGYNGTGLLPVLRKIRTRQWFGPEQIPTYLTTHPALEERIAYIGAWMERRSMQLKPEVLSDDFIKAQTRLIAMYGDEQVALKRYKDKATLFPENSLNHFGYGLILSRIGNRKEAILEFKKSLEKKTFDADVLSELGRIYFLDGQYDIALKTLQSAVSIKSEHPEGLFYLGRAQIELEKYKEAGNTFESLLAVYPNHEDALYFAGEVFGKQGLMEEAHYYLGMYYKSKRDYKNAIFHLKRALEGTKNPSKITTIEDILKEIRKQEPPNSDQNVKNAW